MNDCVESQAQLGRRHSPGFPLPPFQPERLGASRSNSNCETLPEENAEGASEGHLGPMGPREVLLQVRISSTFPCMPVLLVQNRRYRVGLCDPRCSCLQGFNWECAQRASPAWYAVLAGRAVEMRAAGITAIWLPPPSVSVSAEVLLRAAAVHLVLCSTYLTRFMAPCMLILARCCRGTCRESMNAWIPGMEQRQNCAHASRHCMRMA